LRKMTAHIRLHRARTPAACRRRGSGRSTWPHLACCAQSCGRCKRRAICSSLIFIILYRMACRLRFYMTSCSGCTAERSSRRLTYSIRIMPCGSRIAGEVNPMQPRSLTGMRCIGSLRLCSNFLWIEPGRAFSATREPNIPSRCQAGWSLSLQKNPRIRKSRYSWRYCPHILSYCPNTPARRISRSGCRSREEITRIRNRSSACS